jgi:hypothetical protein
MNKNLTQKYIYQDEAEKIFYELAESLQNFYADKVLMSGEAKNGETLMSIDFEVDATNGDLFYSVLLCGLSQSNPKIISQLIYENRIELEFQFFDFGTFGGVSHIYLIKNTMDWKTKDNFFCEVWTLKNTDIKKIKEHWA